MSFFCRASGSRSFAIGFLVIALLGVQFLALHYLPSYFFTSSRELEFKKSAAEIEIRRAVQYFLKVNQRYPLNIKELLFDGKRRYLRKNYLILYPKIILKRDEKNSIIGID